MKILIITILMALVTMSYSQCLTESQCYVTKSKTKKGKTTYSKVWDCCYKESGSTCNVKKSSCEHNCCAGSTCGTEEECKTQQMIALIICACICLVAIVIGVASCICRQRSQRGMNARGQFGGRQNQEMSNFNNGGMMGQPTMGLPVNPVNTNHGENTVRF